MPSLMTRRLATHIIAMLRRGRPLITRSQGRLLTRLTSIGLPPAAIRPITAQTTGFYADR
jgi:hypothetical protein